MISKQNARRVTIGDNVFRHKVSTTSISRGIYRLNITIQSEIHNACKLIVEGLIQKDSSIWPPAAHEDYQFYPTVTRHEVEWLIKDAINKGWDYSAIGPNFTLQASNKIFGLGYLAAQITKMQAESERNQLDQEG
jgi:hypothetical protein